MLISALSTGEKFYTGSITLIIGLIITFVVLGLIIFLLILMKIISEKNILPKKKKNEINQISEISESDNSAVNYSEKQINSDTMTVIESAITAYLANSDEKPHENFKIKSVRKLSREA